MEHTLRQNVSVITGYELELKNGRLRRVHNWFVEEKEHRIECSCGKKFNKESKAVKHLEENQ